MTDKQRQNLLQYLGYYDGIPDGDWGPVSQAACLAFQEDFGGIAQDGFGGPETDKALKHAVAMGFLKREDATDTNVGGKWIPCSERLPKENEYVGDVCKYYLIQDEYGDVYVAHLSSVGWIPINSLKAISDEVVAWQPSPQPYKAEMESEE